MKKLYIVLIIILVLIVVVFVLRFVSGPEDTWVKDSRGVWIKHGNPSNTPDYVGEQQAAIECSQNLLSEKSKIENISSQCLGRCFSYSVDVAHVPRTTEDDITENQCSEYIEGITSSFIELDKLGKIIKIK